MSLKPECLEKDEEFVRVVARCRPMLDREIHTSSHSIIEVDERWARVTCQKLADNVTERQHAYTFDSVYGPRATQEAMYEGACSDVVEKVLQGYNASIIAYGITSAGKTFTMTGVQDAYTPELYGIKSRAFDHIFTHIASSENRERYSVRASCFRIYMETTVDLLERKGRPLDIKEHPGLGVYVKGLSAVKVRNASDLQHLLRVADINNSVLITHMSDQSARISTFFTIDVTYRDPDAPEGKVLHMGKLTLVDLAGNERLPARPGAGAQLRERRLVHQSMMALNHVVLALSDPRYRHVPYRDSKVTRLLADSLGGRAHTLLVANISPASCRYNDTLHTLRFASHVSKIRNRPRVRHYARDPSLTLYFTYILELRKELSTVRARIMEIHQDNREEATEGAGMEQETGSGFVKLSREQQEAERLSLGSQLLSPSL